MPDYSKTKIYIIRSPNTDKVYIGATVESLSARFSKHNCKYRKGTNKTKAVEVLKHGGAYIELLESFPCDNVDESRARELYWIRQFDENKVNKNIPGRTKAEWHQAHKQEKKDYDKLYRLNNKQKISERANKKFECDCGGKYTKQNISKHYRTIKHRAHEFNEHNIFNHL